jgi:hypothetical protein
MRISYRNLLGAVLLLVFASSCEREVIRDVRVDHILYGIDTVPVYASSAEKDRLKTTSQFISTAYTQLYLSPIPSGVLNELSLLRQANGDKLAIGELIISYMLASPEAQATIPSQAEMGADYDAFIRQTYLRFYLRLPTAYETHALRVMLQNQPDLQPVEVYRAFLQSDEYQYY